MRDFHAELAKQLRFLKTSCRQFDEGDVDEGVRIASISANLFHDGGSKSQSLLSHLGVKKTIKLISTSTMLTHAAIGNLTSVNIHFDTLEAEFLPNLDNAPKKLLPFKVWWDQQMIFRLETGENVTRRDLVLWARNRDGGGHIDKDLDPRYEKLMAGVGMGMTIERNGKTLHQVPFRFAHLAALRQIGYETLISPPLLRLAGVRV